MISLKALSVRGQGNTKDFDKRSVVSEGCVFVHQRALTSSFLLFFTETRVEVTGDSSGAEDCNKSHPGVIRRPQLSPSGSD